MATEEQTTYDLAAFLRLTFVRRGQRLTISNRTVSKLSFPIYKVGSPTGNVTFTIRKVSDDSVLLSKVLGDASALETSTTWEEVTFDSPVTINEEVRLLVEYDNGDTDNYVALSYSNSEVKADEDRCLYTTEYTEQTGTDAAYIYTYEIPLAVVSTQEVDTIAEDSAKAHGTIESVETTCDIRGFEPVAVPIASSSELAILAGDGMVLYEGYLYIVSRSGGGAHFVWKVNASNYADYSYADPTDFSGGDGIVVAGGYLWVGDFSGVGVFKLSLSDLSLITIYDCGGLGVTALATDDTYIYAGTDSGGFIYKIKISDGTTTYSTDSIGGSYHIHALCHANGYLYGPANYSESIVFKWNASDLSLVSTLTTTGDSHHDDIVQDDTYFYCVKASGGISRFRKSDLDWTVLEFTDGLPPDGLELVDGKLLLGWGQYGVAIDTHQRIWVGNQSAFTEYNRMALETATVRQINEILVDGNYIHLLQIRGPASCGAWLVKWNKADILTDLIYTREEDEFEEGSFAHNLENLTGGTDYHLRAYARETGLNISYGDAVLFATLAPPSPPAAIALDASSISSDSAWLRGQIE